MHIMIITLTKKWTSFIHQLKEDIPAPRAGGRNRTGDQTMAKSDAMTVWLRHPITYTGQAWKALENHFKLEQTLGKRHVVFVCTAEKVKVCVGHSYKLI